MLNFNLGDHIFIPLSPAHTYFGITTTSCGDEMYTECEILPYAWDMSMSYKVVASPIDQAHFCNKYFYVNDLKLLIEEGYAILKENDNQHVEVWEGIEPIDNTCAYIRHSGTVIVG